MSFDDKLDAYAEVMVAIGLNLRPGQRLIVDASTEAAPLVRKVAAHAYRRGARLVDVMWNDPYVTLARYRYAPEDSFDDLPAWRGEAYRAAGEGGDAVLHLRTPHPDLFDNEDPERVGAVQRANRLLHRPYQEFRDRQRINWTIATCPGQEWADRVFPADPPEERLGKLWDTLFTTVRLNAADPVAAWGEHLAALDRVRDHLQARNYRALHYRGPGTDLEVGLPDGHLWLSARFTRAQGTSYIANLPSEEVFTSPRRDRAEGTVVSTKPLSYAGKLIEGMGLRFEGGRVVEAWAERGEEMVHEILGADAGARHLGEVALVPESSPIARSGLLFYNTLFDENAACHLALGQGFSFCLDGWQDKKEEELAAAGINRSLTHVDFMAGSAQLDIDGVTDGGAEEPIMRSGEWAF